MTGPIANSHLRACPEHGVIAPLREDLDGKRHCPICETGAEARPDAATDIQFNQTDLRWQINPDTLVELLDALEQDTNREGVGPYYVAVAELERSELAAGYTEQERWWNVVIAETGNTTREVFKHDSDAREAIEHINSGGEWLEAQTATHDHLNADPWKGVPEYYARDVDYERVDDDTLHIHMSGFASDNQYSEARREIGRIARAVNLSVRTVEAGGKWSDATIEVSIDG